MGSLLVTAHGAAPPDLAWKRYLNPVEWTGWAPHLTDVSSSTPVLQVGTRGTVTVFYLFKAYFHVHTVDTDNRFWAWTVRLGPLRLVLHHELEAESPGGGTIARIRMHGPTVGLHLYRPLMWWALRRLVG